ncbi:hypothetical protein ACHAXM_005043 [Skeletonema potamos]
MTTKKRNRNKAKTGKTASASDQAPEAAAAAAADQVTEKAQQHRQLQIGNDNNAATICSHGLVVAKVDDKEKEMFTKRVLAKCDDLALAKESTPCDFQAIDRFLIGMDLLPTPSTDGVGVLSRIYFYLEKLMEEEQCNAEKIGMAVVILFAHGDPGETSAGISQWVSSHFLAAGVQHLIHGDIETAQYFKHFNVIEQAVFDCDCACVSVIKENKNNTESSVGVGEIGTDK